MAAMVNSAQVQPLVNAEEQALAHPDTFSIPPRIVREGLHAGDRAKVCFDHKERMWVEVEERVLATGKAVAYRGRLRNDPYVLKLVLSFGDRVDFGPEHVYAVEDRP